MALLWFDGFETYYGDDDLKALSNDIIASVTANVYPAFSDSGRNGRCVSTGANYYAIYNLVNNYTTFIFGFATGIFTSGTPSYSGTRPLVGFQDGATDVQISLHVVGTEIAVYRGDGTLLGTTSGAGLTYQTWRYIEVKFTIDNSSGSVEIRSNESTVLSLTSQDTQYTANAYFNAIKTLGAYYNSLTGRYDDMYWCDTTGSKNNDFLGDVRVDILRPNAAGTYTDFTPSAGSNYENVDDDPYPDDNTTYNDGSDVGDKDTYNIENLPSPSGTTIIGVKNQITVRKTDAGPKECKILTIAGTTEDLGDAITLSDSFTTHTKIYEDNPDDSADWQDADINAMEVGIQITI